VAKKGKDFMHCDLSTQDSVPASGGNLEFQISNLESSRGCPAASAASWAWKLIPVIVISLAVKCLLARYFLFVGDEAYFTLWGKHISAGYYDHPPMIGWLLHLLLYVGDSVLLLRLLPIAFSTAVGVGLYVLLKPYDERKAYLVFLLFMVSPMNAAFFLVAPDDPLLLFSFVSVFLLVRAEALAGARLFKAERTADFTDCTDLLSNGVNPCKSVSKRAETRGSDIYYFLSGVFWGLAFLSKYFAVLLAFSYLVYFLSLRKSARRIKGVILFALGAIPFVAQNAFWNYQNGWPNIMHNWFNRFGSNPNPAVNLLCLGLSLLYLMTPPVVYFLLKNRARILHAVWKENPSTEFTPSAAEGLGTGFRIFALAALVPLCVFVIVSLKKSVGPHWYWSFLPCAFVAAGLTLDANQIVKSIRFSCVFSLIQTCLLLAFPLTPLESLKGLVSEGDRASLIFYIHPQKVVRLLEQYGGDFVFATRSYSASALLEYHLARRRGFAGAGGGEPVIVFGNGSRHARQDDIRTDFKKLDGKNLLILEIGKAEESRYSTCFEKVQIKPLCFRRGTLAPAQAGVEGSLFLVLGYDFRYQEYRQMYLRGIVSRFYQIPAWLPHANNFFREKYNL
jgi:4-amino-4-deoxy-L-arabinose transferase-like glycosyltransferase